MTIKVTCVLARQFRIEKQIDIVNVHFDLKGLNDADMLLHRKRKISNPHAFSPLPYGMDAFNSCSVLIFGHVCLGFY